MCLQDMHHQSCARPGSTRRAFSWRALAQLTIAMQGHDDDGESAPVHCSNPRETEMLTPRQQRFVEEYLVDPNGHQAALRAGYAPRGARQTVTHLLKHPEISAAIRRGMDDRAQRMRLDADRVLAELARIAFADIGNLA